MKSAYLLTFDSLFKNKYEMFCASGAERRESLFLLLIFSCTWLKVKMIVIKFVPSGVG